MSKRKSELRYDDFPPDWTQQMVQDWLDRQEDNYIADLCDTEPCTAYYDWRVWLIVDGRVLWTVPAMLVREENEANAEVD